MLTEWGRRVFRPVFEAIARALSALHLTPNAVTLGGLLLSVVVAFLIVTDHLLAAGLLYIIAGGADAIDGTLARMQGVRSPFGGFWDSTLDRLAEAIVVSSIGYWAAVRGDTLGVLIGFVALTASYMVSYTRSRAESIGVDCKVGIGTRVERYLILVISLVLGYPIIGLGVIAVLSGITAVQRIHFVWRATRTINPLSDQP